MFLRMIRLQGKVFRKTMKELISLRSKFPTLVEIVYKKVVTPAPVKAVEESCVTCNGPHAWYNCPNTDNNQSSVCTTTGTYNQVNPSNRVSNQMTPPGFAPVQNNDQNSFGEVLRLKKSNHFSSGNTTPFFDSRPSLVSFETSDSLLEEFADELALLNPFPPGNEDADVEAELREIELLLNRDPSTNFHLREDVQEENFHIYSNPLFEFNDEYISSDVNPLFDEAIEDIKCKDSYISVVSILGGFIDEPPLEENDDLFDLECDNDEIDAFLAIEVPTYIEEGYYDSDGDVLYLERLLIDDTTHNIFSESRWQLNVQWKFVLPHVSSPRTNEFGDPVKLCDSVTKSKALRGRHPMLIHFSSFYYDVRRLVLF
ncbi:hypothetical protein Tco_1187640 [Tanacetum coccineum]